MEQETLQQRRERILAERARRREDFQKQKENPTYRRWLIFKQNFNTKYYEITQNTRNTFAKYTSKGFWTARRQYFLWLYKEYIKQFHDFYIELTVNTPTNLLNFYKEFTSHCIYYLVLQFKPSAIVEQERTNVYLSKLLFHYNQTLLNEEWLLKFLSKRNTGMTRLQLIQLIDDLILESGFDIVDRNKTMYDLMVAVNKERIYRKIRETDWTLFGSPEFTVTEEQMKRAERDVDSNLNEWKEFLKVFK